MQHREDNLLEIEDLAVDFRTRHASIEAVRGISLSIPEGSTVALLGESGCGKSLTGLSILGLIDPPGRISRGAIRFRGKTGKPVDLLGMDERGERLRQIRGGEISVIFQDARESMTPVYTIGEQIIEMLLAHEPISRVQARQRAISALAEVGIPAPERRLNEYPYQLSGGMCQRAMIAMALACRPRLLIADEPTTALDVTIQAQVLDLLMNLQESHGMSILMITHDMGVVAEVADHVAVMYLGKIVESGSVAEIFANPLHPYTQGLFSSMPRPNSDPGVPLPRIRGSVPDLQQTPAGCPFRGRCPHEMPLCTKAPPMEEHATAHHAACWLLSEKEETVSP